MSTGSHKVSYILLGESGSSMPPDTAHFILQNLSRQLSFYSTFHLNQQTRKSPLKTYEYQLGLPNRVGEGPYIRKIAFDNFTRNWNRFQVKLSQGNLEAIWDHTAGDYLEDFRALVAGYSVLQFFSNIKYTLPFSVEGWTRTLTLEEIHQNTKRAYFDQLEHGWESFRNTVDHLLISLAWGSKAQRDCVETIWDTGYVDEDVLVKVRENQQDIESLHQLLEISLPHIRRRNRLNGSSEIPKEAFKDDADRLASYGERESEEKQKISSQLSLEWESWFVAKTQLGREVKVFRRDAVGDDGDNPSTS